MKSGKSKSVLTLGISIATRFGFGFKIGAARIYPFLEYNLSVSYYPEGITSNGSVVREEVIGAGIIFKTPSPFSIGASLNIEGSANLEPVHPASKYYLSLFAMF